MGAVIDQIITAFDTTFSDLITKSEVRISHFFLFVQGRFTQNFKERLLKSERLVTYMHRLHFYDGEQTEQLKTRAFRQVRALLEAQLAEIEWNRDIVPVSTEK